MKGIAVSGHLQESYRDYYEEGDSEWRRICALDKADNIVSLCTAVTHACVLEIGAGEGAILKRLSELQFGDRLYALEISSSGVAAINRNHIPRSVECILFDGLEIESTDGFADLHTTRYRQILAGSGYGLEDAKPAVDIASNIRRSKRVGLTGEYHPMLRRNDVSPRALRRAPSYETASIT